MLQFDSTVQEAGDRSRKQTVQAEELAARMQAELAQMTAERDAAEVAAEESAARMQAELAQMTAERDALLQATTDLGETLRKQSAASSSDLEERVQLMQGELSGSETQLQQSKRQVEALNTKCEQLIRSSANDKDRIKRVQATMLKQQEHITKLEEELREQVSLGELADDLCTMAELGKQEVAELRSKCASLEAE